ncbi:TetR/AcrR family transcriptional regulator C-terminal domain-containing protein [Arsenicicoccus dermatophilus]|uniref:TetR/AcrR family transcriptional regulator C-terminal domain-containing protein n=1 Tax=Arsenicicoccus dermatophilus TaxID=1076331 RepID=UPI003917120D
MPLTRDEVLAVAVATLDAYGFADLSMRKLAGALEVQPSALYWHFANKQTLLAAIAESWLGSVPAPDATSAWDEQVRAWAHGLRGVLTAHRDGAELVASVLAMRAESVDPTRGLVAVLHQAGLRAPAARAAAATVLHFVMGHTVDEQGHAQMRAFGVAPATGGVPDDPDERFDYGLGLLVEGIRSRLPA